MKNICLIFLSSSLLKIQKVVKFHSVNDKNAFRLCNTFIYFFIIYIIFNILKGFSSKGSVHIVLFPNIQCVPFCIDWKYSIEEHLEFLLLCKKVQSAAQWGTILKSMLFCTLAPIGKICFPLTYNGLLWVFMFGIFGKQNVNSALKKQKQCKATIAIRKLLCMNK